MIIEVAVQIIVMLAFGLIQAIPQLLSKMPEILAAIVGGILQIIPMIMNIGGQIIAGLWEGMKSMFPNFTKGIEEFFSGVVDGIKNLLGIKSPSRVFAGIGENMGLGLGEGFLSAMSGVEKDMQSAIPTNFDINASLNGLQPAFSGVPNQAVSYNHTGTIRVEGINTKGELSGVVDIIIDELRKEVRR
jgi:phage-related protein